MKLALTVGTLLLLAALAAAQQVIPGVNQIRLVDGFASTPSRSYINDTNTGSYRIGADNEGFTAAGVLRWDYNITRLNMSDGYGITFDASAGFFDRGANQIAMRNSTNAQAFYIYKTYTDDSNGSFGFLGWSGGELQILASENGSGGGSSINVGTTGGTNLYFKTANTQRWAVDSNGHLLALGAHNIGDGSGNSPVNLYVESFISGVEEAEPAAPAANNYRLYAKDSGGGKTQLCVRFASGASQCFATEP